MTIPTGYALAPALVLVRVQYISATEVHITIPVHTYVRTYVRGTYRTYGQNLIQSIDVLNGGPPPPPPPPPPSLVYVRYDNNAILVFPGLARLDVSVPSDTSSALPDCARPKVVEIVLARHCPTPMVGA